MMDNTLGGFCRDLLDGDDSGQPLDPERMAASFVDHFGLSARPSLEELTALAERAGFGTVQEGTDGRTEGRPRRTARGRVPHLPPVRPVGRFQGPHRTPRVVRDRPGAHGRDPLAGNALPIRSELRDLPAGGTLRGGGADAARTSSCPTPGPAGWTWRPSTMSLAAPTPRRPCGWPRWCGTRLCWWSCTSGKSGETPKAGPSRPCCEPGW